MGIYIKDIDMPKTCEECRYFIKRMNHISLDYKYYCINGASALVFPNVYENIAFDCPLIEIPEPHGRLIDESTIMDVYYKRVVHENGEFKFPMIKVVGTDAPTVIERSKR